MEEVPRAGSGLGDAELPGGGGGGGAKSEAERRAEALAKLRDLDDEESALVVTCVKLLKKAKKLELLGLCVVILVVLVPAVLILKEVFEGGSQAALVRQQAQAEEAHQAQLLALGSAPTPQAVGIPGACDPGEDHAECGRRWMQQLQLVLPPPTPPEAPPPAAKKKQPRRLPRKWKPNLPSEVSSGDVDNLDKLHEWAGKSIAHQVQRCQTHECREKRLSKWGVKYHPNGGSFVGASGSFFNHNEGPRTKRVGHANKDGVTAQPFADPVQRAIEASRAARERTASKLAELRALRGSTGR
mmetsp:Transcript_30995/g.101035  ORF Transcript_30995/g.101035 Transcript_30995/m.101035 type:complete len:299 (-) Transcript_30995:100-996(-)